MRTGGQRERRHGHQPEAADRRRRRSRARRSTRPRRTSTARSTFLQMHALKDADDARASGGLLGRHGRDVVQGLHADHARRAGRGDRRGAQARAEGHRASLLGDLRRGRGPRHRQPRARLLRRRPTSSPTSSPTSAPGRARGQQTIAALDENGAPFKALVKKLVDKHVALTSTLTVFETFTPGRPMPPGLDVLAAAAEASSSSRRYAAHRRRTSSRSTRRCFRRRMALERAFARAGGLLIAGTDPTGAGGVIPGYSNQRQLELLVEAGFTPLEAIAIGTLNGATYLGRDARVGSIAVGKQADLVVDRRRSVDDDRRRAQGRDRVQAGRRLRSGEADRVGDGQSRTVVRFDGSAPPLPSRSWQTPAPAPAAADGRSGLRHPRLPLRLGRDAAGAADPLPHARHAARRTRRASSATPC